ncbi:ATP-binding protein [Nonomuraea zeae]|uniref:ATP-binding protein n=1 Tax=Nonomuraea zeae TaxID=1642303 RepID=UPI0023F241D4|nr:LuxR family transcriptional regulator [Nonomuraea zeae]
MTADRMISPVLVGRAAELRSLLSVVTRVPAVVLIEGEAGIGKTRLVGELASELGDRLLLVGGCAQIREPFPLGPLLDALRGTGERLERVRLSPVTAALHPLLPELAPFLPPALTPLDDPAGRRHQVFRGLAELLRALGRVVLVLEDLHWADEQTAEFLGYLLADPPSELALVLTFRGEEAGPGMRALMTRRRAEVTRAHIVLAPLNVAETNELTAAILGTQQVSEEFAVYLCERASGLPYAIQELVALLRSRGTLIQHGTGWARKALDELDVPAGVRDSVLERVRGLSGSAQAMAEAAAVLQVPVPVSVLVATCHAPPEEARAGLVELLERGLFAERADAVGFRHMLAVQAVYESVPLPRRQALHTRAAAAVSRQRPEPLGQIAHHLRRAGDLDAWVDAAEKAAAQAVALANDAEAERLLEAVLRHAPLDPAREGRLAVRLGWAGSYALSAEEVIDLLRGAVERQPAGPVRGELNYLIGLQHERSGALRERYSHIAAAVPELVDNPFLAASAMVGLGIPTGAGIPLAEHLSWLDRARDLIPAIAEPEWRVSILGKVAMVLTCVGDPRRAALTEQMLEQTGRRPASRWEVMAYESVGANATLAGHHDAAKDLLSLALAEAVRHDVTRLIEFRCRVDLVVQAYCSGSWHGLAEEAEDLRDRFSDQRTYRVLIETVENCLALAQGRLDGIRLDDMVRENLRMGAVDALPLPVGALLRLATSQGEAGAAVAGTAEAFALWADQDLWPVGVRAVPALAEALVSVGRADEAAELVARLDRELAALDAPLVPAALDHARGFLTGDAERFTAAATAYDRLPAPYEAAQAREQAALRLFAVDDERAAALLAAAIEGYGGLGAHWDLDRATKLARQRGLSSPVRHRGGPRGYGSELSPRESAVARLAATGLTNKEIAKELFVSAKTVEKHLGAAMRKLGLHSRAAIAHRLAELQ